MKPATCRHSRAVQAGFTLIEVMVAMVILALSLTVLLQGNVASMAAVERIDGMTNATLLGRLKMQEIERELLKKGFKADTEETDGDFEDLGHGDIKWKAKVDPVKVQLDKLTEMATSFGGGAGGAGDAKEKMPQGSQLVGGDPLAMLQPLLTPIAQGISQNLRLVQLEVSWPEGTKKRGKIALTSLVTSKQMQTSTPMTPNLPGQTTNPGNPGAPSNPGNPGTPNIPQINPQVPR